MASFGTIRFWQAVCTACLFSALLTGLFWPLSCEAQQKRYRPPPDYVQLSRPDQEVGRRALAEFRSVGLRDSFYLEFVLRVLPRRGAERRIEGRLWEAHEGADSFRRLELNPTSANQAATSRLLLQGGNAPQVWLWRPEGDGGVKTLGGKAIFDRLDGTDLTPFDLQMPFLEWKDVEFEGVRKIRGRPSHSFLFYPPSDYAAWQPSLSGVRVYLDTQYNALVQVEQLGEQGRIEKSMSVLDLKKVGERWIVKTIDVRDEITRNKTRFSVTAAALGQSFSGMLFSPAELGNQLQAPVLGLTRIEP
ncbi:MAG: outer membrane lipoprotein-sorting protein [Opitutaceae bacterium]